MLDRETLNHSIGQKQQTDNRELAAMLSNCDVTSCFLCADWTAALEHTTETTADVQLAAWEDVLSTPAGGGTLSIWSVLMLQTDSASDKSCDVTAAEEQNKETLH